jgi:hypothetical protein
MKQWKSICLCLCILYYWLSLFPVCPMLSVSLYSLLLIFTVSCVPNVVCVSVFSIIDCHCFMCAQCCLCLCIVYYWLLLFPVFPMLYVCLYCPLLIVTLSCAPNVFCVSVLSIIDCHCFLCALCCMCLCIGYYWHRQHWAHRKQWQSIIENTETQTTLGTQETVTINNREYRDTDNIGHTGNSDNQ